MNMVSIKIRHVLAVIVIVTITTVKISDALGKYD